MNSVNSSEHKSNYYNSFITTGKMSSYEEIVLVGDSRLHDFPATQGVRVLARGGLTLGRTVPFVKEMLKKQQLKNSLFVLCVGVNDVLKRECHPMCKRQGCRRPYKLSLPVLDVGWEEKLLGKLKTTAKELELLFCGEGSSMLITCPGPVHVTSILKRCTNNRFHRHHLTNHMTKEDEEKMTDKFENGLMKIHEKLTQQTVYQNLKLCNRSTFSMYLWTTKICKSGVRKVRDTIFKDGLHYNYLFVSEMVKHVKIFSNHVLSGEVLQRGDPEVTEGQSSSCLFGCSDTGPDWSNGAEY